MTRRVSMRAVLSVSIRATALFAFVVLFVSLVPLALPSASAQAVAIPYCSTGIPNTSCPPASCAIVNGGAICTRDANGDLIPEYASYSNPGSPASASFSNQNGGARATYAGAVPTHLVNAPNGVTIVHLDATTSVIPIPTLPTFPPALPATPSVSTQPPGVSNLPSVPRPPTSPRFAPRTVSGDAYAPHNTGATWRITFVDANHNGTPERIDVWFFSPQRGLTQQSYATGLP